MSDLISFTAMIVGFVGFWATMFAIDGLSKGAISRWVEDIFGTEEVN